MKQPRSSQADFESPAGISGSAASATSEARRWGILGIVGLGVAVGPLDSSVNIAFPAITAAFGIAVTTIQWVVICYVLTYASLLLGCGRLSDIIGHRRVFLFGSLWSAASLFLCGAAPGFGWFLAARCLQGIGTALVFSCGPALATLSFPEATRARALGMYTMLSAVAATAGPLLGGQLVALWGWQAVYYFRVPIALLAALLTWLFLRQPVDVRPGQRFDGLGAVTLTVAIAGILLVLNRGHHFGWTSAPTLLALGVAGGCLGLFIRHELRTPEPVIDIRLFRHLAFTIANLAHVFLNVASFTVMLLAPYYLLSHYHASAVAGGVLLAMSPLGIMLASPLGGKLLTRVASRSLNLYGLVLAMAGLYGVSLLQTTSSPWLVAAVLSLHGFGVGLFQVANMDFVMGTIPRHQQGVAGSLTMLTRTVGVVGGATLGARVFGWLQPYYAAQLQSAAGGEVASQAFMLAFRGAFLCAAAIAALACLLVWSSRFIAREPRA